MNINIEQLTHTLVIDGPMPAKDVAKAVGKPYSSLLRELNPCDSGAKLGVDTFVKILEATGDTGPLAKIAAHFGLALTPLEEK